MAGESTSSGEGISGAGSVGRVLVAGASGLIGRAALEVFAASPDWEVTGLSRRAPGLAGTPHLSVDLLDREACRRTLGAPRAQPPFSHLVYCALQERPGLVGGWRDRELMETNRRMLENLLDALETGNAPGGAGSSAGSGTSGVLEHVSLLQGAKAYGAHLHPIRVPGREREARDDHESFYWLQEDLLRSRAARGGFHFTIWRPPVVFGHALGSPMNPLAAVAAFASLMKAEGEPLRWPGGRTAPQDGVDARLLARALLWATRSPAARDEIFNVSNGDVFLWENLWPAVARAMDMELGEPEPRRLAEFLPDRVDRWAALVEAERLQAPDLLEWVDDSGLYADLLLNTGRDEPPPPSLLSTVKLRQAGFQDCIDTEDMLVEWLERLQSERFIPGPHAPGRPATPDPDGAGGRRCAREAVGQRSATRDERPGGRAGESR